MEVPLDMQRYLNGVNNFLGSLMEKVEAQLDSSNAGSSGLSGLNYQL